MTSLQSKSAGALLAALGTRGHSGITCAAHDGDATRLDITVGSGAWAVLADGTVLADELVSTHIDGLSIAGNYRLWLDYVEVAAAYEPVWTVTSITPTPPTPSALDICTVDVGSGGISAIGPTEGGLRSLPQQTSTATLPAGVPVLRGPYVVDYTDIPHDADKKTLWVPQVGDVLLRVFSDPASEIHWDSGQVIVGQNPTFPSDSSAPTNIIAHGNNPVQGPGQAHVDNIVGATNGSTWDSAGQLGYLTATVFTSTDPVVAMTGTGGDPDPTQGHVALYALVARAVAP